MSDRDRRSALPRDGRRKKAERPRSGAPAPGRTEDATGARRSRPHDAPTRPRRNRRAEGDRRPPWRGAHPARRNAASRGRSRWPSLDGNRVLTLTQLRFIDRDEAVHFLGQPCSGKTHLAIALGVEVVKAGRSVYFCTLAE